MQLFFVAACSAFLALAAPPFGRLSAQGDSMGIFFLKRFLGFASSNLHDQYGVADHVGWAFLTFWASGHAAFHPGEPQADGACEAGVKAIKILTETLPHSDLSRIPRFWQNEIPLKYPIQSMACADPENGASPFILGSAGAIFWQNEIPLKNSVQSTVYAHPQTRPSLIHDLSSIITAGDPAERSAEGFGVDGGGKILAGAATGTGAGAAQ